MVDSISNGLSAGMRLQLQSFKEKTGDLSVHRSMQYSPPKTASSFSAQPLENATALFKSKSSLSYSSFLANIENTAYGKHLESVFNPAPLVDAEKDGLKVKISASDWEKDTQEKINDITSRILAITESWEK